ncbi:MAG: butyrate kinase [Oscillospiraceae bacterium]|jgi:butyrate kinase
MSEKLIFTINPGSTSTKLALYKGSKEVFSSTTRHSANELNGLKIIDQLSFRLNGVLGCLSEHNVDPKDFDIIVCRGSSLPGIGTGAYKVTEHMLNVNRYAPAYEHASNLAAFIGWELAKPYGTPVIIYDATAASDLTPEAKTLGLPDLDVVWISHVLNTRRVCIMTANKLGKEFEQSNFVAAHMGGGISVSAYRKGKIIDTIMSDMGPISPERAGRIPGINLVEMCFSGKYTEAEMKRKFLGSGGCVALLGTQDMFEVENRAVAGEEPYRGVFYAMAYGAGKAIGEMAAVLKGEIDRIILTGGLARAKIFCDWVSEMVGFMAPIEIIPGEFEMEALAEGGLRVLEGRETVREYITPPRGYKTVEEFYNKTGIKNPLA